MKRIGVLIIILFGACSNSDNSTDNNLREENNIISKDTLVLKKHTVTKKTDTIPIENNESKVHYNTSIDYKNLSKSLNDTCILANKLRKRILDFIYLNDKNLYNESFLILLEKNTLINSACHYPRNVEEISLYYYLGEEILLKEAEKDNRATKLILDLYINNKNNVEFSQFYTFVILQKLVFIDLESFIKVISKYDEKDMKKCIVVFEYIGKTTEKKEIKDQLNNPNKTYNQSIKEKILRKLK